MEKVFERPYYIQRLNKPFSDGSGNPFSFGGGRLNGGFTEEASKLLNKIFTFDYMGAAEFEFGAVPKALDKINKMALNGELICFEIMISKTPVFVLAPECWQDLITEFITAIAADDYSPKWRTKESTALSHALGFTGRDPKDIRTVGWLELDNGFMFFTDRKMFEATAELFNVPILENTK